MGVLVDSQKEGFGSSWGGLKNLVRRKQVDCAQTKRLDNHQLAKELTIPHLIAVGVGSTIGAGVYILVGAVAREHSGPALTMCFLIAGIAAALSAFCYAELASRCPSAGSAYHYSYICVGEGVAWLVGWALILEYTIGGSAVARGVSPNLALLFGGENSLPTFLARQHLPGLDVMVDPCAAVLVLIVTGFLCLGIKESALAQGIVTAVNVFAMLFVIIAGGYLGFKTGWTGYEVPTGYFPFGVDGMLAGSATVFFSYIGFDTVASTAEEVYGFFSFGSLPFIKSCLFWRSKELETVRDRNLPFLLFQLHNNCWSCYCPYLNIDGLNPPSVLNCVFQPRILMAMARDGLLPSFFLDVNKHTQVPVNSTLATGIVASILAFFMDVSQLTGMLVKVAFLLQVSVGTLLAFTMVAVSVLILRYVPPDEVPLPSSLQESIDSYMLRHNSDTQMINGENPAKSPGDPCLPLLGEKNVAVDCTVVEKLEALSSYFRDVLEGTLDEENRRKIAGWTIMLICVGAFILTFAASNLWFSSLIRFTFCGAGGLLLLSGLVILTCIDQDDERHNFGHAGGFICPFVPLLPISCILINVYLLINLEVATWVRVSVWLMIGVLIYTFYGRRHSSLLNAIYVPKPHVDEIYRSSGATL
ncbi:cationic amino acid transporter 2, vacuolar-like isoform X2 [Gossypium australe]|uniref:Cationic amino acid transporter 2, vacuolar-like isoform X2 n=1 Tax=Gossypium australe TaxID=47621 RepID=A0A5B6X0K0_9ROSI|nr:cationic amino acid transporter 2, vacuolar-like isoform X2 [Gossypium australe]